MDGPESLKLDPDKHYSKSFNKQAGVTYVYEVIENHWDKDKKQPRNKRRLIGKIDPVTGDIIPTKKKKSKSDSPIDYEALYKKAMKTINSKNAEIQSLTQELESLQSKYSNLVNSLTQLLQSHPSS